MKCGGPWETIAPFVGAETALCDDANSSKQDAGMDAEPGFDAGDDSIADASPAKSKPIKVGPSQSSSGCTVTAPRAIRMPSWRTSLLSLLMLAGWIFLRRPARSSQRPRSGIH
jgi:hypothetical protein